MKKQNADKEAFKKTLDEITRETGYDFDISHKEFAYIAAVNYHKMHTNKLNTTMSDKQFTDGLYFHYPHEKSYDKMKVKIERAKLIEWLMKQEAEIWIKVRESKNGKLYGEVDTWKPEPKAAPAPQPQPADEGEDLPF